MLGLGDLIRGLTGWRIRGDYARGPCPRCGSRTGGWATVTQAAVSRVGCFAGCDWRDLRALFGLQPGGAHAAVAFQPVSKPTDRPKAPDMVDEADALDAVYGVLMRHLPMSSDRRRTVLGRDRGIPKHLRAGMSPLMAPMPRDPRERRRLQAAIVEDLRRIAPDGFLRRVPELWARKCSGYVVLGGRDGARYFEPWHDVRGRIVALRAYMGRRAAAKYLTSKGRKGPLLHFALGVPWERIGQVPWILAEGWMKAEVAAQHFGCVAVALAGVTQKAAWKRALEVKREVAPDAPLHVAFDAEAWTTRPDIAVLALELARLVWQVEGRTAGFAVWDAYEQDGAVNPKGIDDAIVSDVEVRLVPRLGFAGYLDRAVRSWERRAAA